MSVTPPPESPDKQVDTPLVSQRDIEEAIVRGIRRYFADCRKKVPEFIDSHFQYPGALATNKVALGWDLARAPVNLFWAPFYAVISVTKFVAGKSRRLNWLQRILGEIPAGFTTRVQRRISELVMNDLLGYGQQADSLNNYIVQSLEERYEDQTGDQIDSLQFHQRIAPLVTESLVQYQVTRTASADIGNSLSCIILGAFAFKKFTPGGIGIALVVAPILARDIAAREFIFGDALGRIYYGIFPPEPSSALTAGVIAAVMALLAAVAALSGVVTDPFQAAIGLHRRRLHKMLDHMERDLVNQTRGGFRPKDQFVARILDAFDVIRSGLT